MARIKATDNHGSAKLYEYCTTRLNTFDIIKNGDTCGGFLIGQNRQPGQKVGNRFEDCHHGLHWSPTQNRGHGLCVGPNRVGKGSGIIVPAALVYGGNMVFLDFKGELAWLTAERRRQLGQRTVIIDPVGVVNRHFGSKAGVSETVTRYNPLYGLDARAATFADDITAIVTALVRDDQSDQGTNAYWSRAARDVVAGIVAAEVIGNGKKASFRNVRRVLNLDNQAFEEFCRDACGMFQYSLVADKLRQFTDMSIKSNQEVKSTARFQTGFLDSKNLQDSMETDTDPFTFDQLGTHRLSVYIVCPPSEVDTFSGWLRLLVTNAMRSLMRNRPSLDLPVVFMLDELPVLGALPVITQSYGVAAGAGIVMWSCVQDLTQLKALFPLSWETIWNNSACIQVFANQDNFTTKYVSDFLGTRTVQTVQKSQSRQGFNTNTSESFGEVGRPLMFPHEIKALGEGLLAIYSDNSCFKSMRFRYFDDARFWGLYRPDPNYAPIQQKVGRHGGWFSWV